MILKSSNITVVGDGLNTVSVNALQLPDLGKPKSLFQMGQLGVVDFGKYTILIHADQKRAYVTDNSGDLTAKSPVTQMVKVLLQGSKDLKLEGLGVNFILEAALDEPIASFLRETYFREEAISRFGEPVTALGFKVTVSEGDHLLTVTVDPVWNNPTTAQITINFHLEVPPPDISSRIVEMYGTFVEQVPSLVNKIFL
jgi:hypothetical protein